MRKFKVSDRFTTADIGLELLSDNIEGLFLAGAEGMFAIILGREKTGTAVDRKEISLEATSTEQLLVDWLSELLYFFDTDGLIASDMEIEITPADKGHKLKSNVGFLKYDRESDAAEHEIKAVTYYKLDIEKKGGIYRCHVVFDL